MGEFVPKVSVSFETKYELKEKIGQGGMGYVFKAVERSNNRPLAIKFFKRILFGDVSAQQHFVQEAKLLASLSSSGGNSNLVNVYGFGSEGDNLYIAFEYVAGVTLRQWMNDGCISTVRDACEIIISMCRGLALLHQKQIVHMDLKPENVMIPVGGGLKIIDLGISLSLNQRKNSSASDGIILGTPAYMSPEQCSEQKITYRSDLYSVGVIFYELLAGMAPFWGTTPQIVKKHLELTPKAFERHNVSVPDLLEDIVFSLLNKDPAHRPRSALYLAGELKKLLRLPELSEAFSKTLTCDLSSPVSLHDKSVGSVNSPAEASTVRIKSGLMPKQSTCDTSAGVGAHHSARAGSDTSARVSSDTSARVSSDTSARVSSDTSARVSSDTSARAGSDISVGAGEKAIVSGKGDSGSIEADSNRGKIVLASFLVLLAIMIFIFK